MVENSEVLEEGYAGSISRGFVLLQPQTLIALGGTDIADYRDEPLNKSEIKHIVYNAFEKCAYFHQKFDSDPERRFAAILEQPQNEVLRWVKPARGQFKIFMPEGIPYNPDFVVETKTDMYICEPKRRDEINSSEVLRKRDAAVAWCEHANKHAAEYGGKPWKYALIPDDEIRGTSTFKALVDRFAVAT
jgi:type III restriction enzyme